jgi:hypothetical protein
MADLETSGIGRGTAGPGRPKGLPNKATSAAREAIASFVDGNAPKLQEWLTAVANGDPENDIKPNPAKAFELFQSVVEYHIPKLARTELTGENGGPLRIVASSTDESL